MFLACMADERSRHELDFRFQWLAEGTQFLFAHHGLSLSDLAGTLDLSRLGSSFYMVEARSPFTLVEIIADPHRFLEQYGVEPTVAYEQYLWFDLTKLGQFFQNTADDDELDCIIVGKQGDLLSQAEFDQWVQPLRSGEVLSSLSGSWDGSWLRTHGNHFLWLVSQSPDLLRWLIAESILGFFNHIHPHDYQPLPQALIDLIVAEYHTAPLVCFPTEWANGKEVPVGVQSDQHAIRALIETAEASWIAYQLSPPRHLVGRGLLVSYDLHQEAWSYESWA